jgi:hypothetical protein
MLREASAESLLDLVLEGELDAAVVPPQVAYELLEDERFSAQGSVAEGMSDITGDPVMSSVLVTHPDVAERSGVALAEARELLAASAAYLEANRQDAVSSLAVETGVDEEYAAWLTGRQAIEFGSDSDEVQRQIVDMWDAALAVGDIEAVPSIAEALVPLDDGAGSPKPAPGKRVTLSIALQDSPMQRLAVLAIERGLVSSDAIDLDITFLPQSDLAQAAAARQYDIIEVSPVAVPTGEARDLELKILSGGLQDISSTLLFTASERAD